MDLQLLPTDIIKNISKYLIKNDDFRLNKKLHFKLDIGLTNFFSPNNLKVNECLGLYLGSNKYTQYYKANNNLNYYKGLYKHRNRLNMEYALCDSQKIVSYFKYFFEFFEWVEYDERDKYREMFEPYFTSSITVFCFVPPRAGWKASSRAPAIRVSGRSGPGPGGRGLIPYFSMTRIGRGKPGRAPGPRHWHACRAVQGGAVRRASRPSPSAPFHHGAHAGCPDPPSPAVLASSAGKRSARSRAGLRLGCLRTHRPGCLRLCRLG